MSKLTVRKQGSRIYVLGESYPYREQLRNLNCHWDSAARAWWVGVAKEVELMELIERINQGAEAAAPVSDNIDNQRVYGKVDYKERNYYVIGRNREETRYYLSTLDGKTRFWVDAAATKWLKTYHEKERYGRKTPMTLGDLARFIEKRKQAEKEIKEGRIPGGYAIDLEDGLIKPIWECDMPDRHY
ncbi:MAG: hypothetical protein SNJ49_15230 [Chloracidobacterium sp.]